MSINIDTEKLNVQIEEIRSVISNLKDILESINKDTERIKEDWSTSTASSVYTSFEDFYKSLQNVIDTLNKDIYYLEKVASNNYEKSDIETSSSVDNNIAI